jgi:hypothetical protein
MGTGSCPRERRTASPRKTWVPGVQACAVPGNRTTSTSATASIPPNRASAVSRWRVWSDPHTLALVPEDAAQVAQFVLDEAVDAIARCAHRLADVVLDAIHGDAIDELAALFACPLGSRGACAVRALAGSARAAEHWCEGAVSRRAASQQKRCRGANGGANEGRGE